MALNLAQKSSIAGLNSGGATIARQVRIADIHLSEEFASLFPVNPAVWAQIVERIKKYGFDNSQPLHIWKERKILLDGHTRRLAALECGLTTVPVFEHSFATEEEAMEYALGLQTARRNLTDAELLSALEKLDRLKKRGRPDEKEPASEKGKSAEHLAKVLGTSTSKVEKARTVSKKASEEVKAALASGEMTLNAAYKTLPVKKAAVTAPKNLYQKIIKMSSAQLASFLSDIQRKDVLSCEEWEERLRETSPDD